VDFAGVVEGVGQGTTRFVKGDEVFGQLFIPPLGSTGTYAEFVAVTEDAPLAKVPNGLEAAVAAALPTAGVTALQIVTLLAPLAEKTVLIVGAAGGVGSFTTQLAVNAGAHVIADARSDAADRLRGYGVAEIVDYTQVSVTDAVRRAHAEGIDVLIDVVNDADGFAALASLVRSGGTALTTHYVADTEALAADRVTGVNFQVHVSTELLEMLANAVVAGRIVVPPITKIELDDVPSAMNGGPDHHEGKTVITM
jgi:NADPH:quinone reductase-like Zn-dependent oxidoreductase